MLTVAMLASSAVSALAAEVGESLKVGDYTESAAETQKLIDSRPDIQRPMENLNRGAVAVRMDGYTYISWRWLGTESADTRYNIYRSLTEMSSYGQKINNEPLNATNFTDLFIASDDTQYFIVPVVNGEEQWDKVGAVQLWDNNYMDIPIQKPENNKVNGEEYSYTPGDASVGDLDGDGEYEIILKWDPSNSHDNAQEGYTGEVYIDCYRMNGEQLWRINLGKNIRAGAHYTQFMVYDLDGDGKAEVVMRTADGTVDGKGKVIGNADADYREAGTFDQSRNQMMKQGRILKGKEYLTVFSGDTGEALHTIDYIPARGNVADWGDAKGNRSDRFLACVAYLDGVHPSVVMCRGYYTRTVLAAFDWNGKELKNRWVFDSNHPGCEQYAGQGNHNLRVGDVDGDGCDEIIYGSCAIDHNGKGLYSTQMGHGDAIHLTHFDPSRKGLQVWDCHENKRDGSTYRDAATGEVLLQLKSNTDVGRCMAADIDPTHPGVEMWSGDSQGIRNVKGEIIAPKMRNMPTNMAVWWDGDLLRELLDRNMIIKYDWENKKFVPLVKFTGTLFNNGTKSNPCLQGDIIGDWREEVLVRSENNAALRLYVSTIPTEYRFHTFLEEPIYRISIATQNVGYNQPTQPGFYFGPDLIKMKGTFRGYQFK